MSYISFGVPLPMTNNVDTKEWWAHCRRHELVVQRCTDCGAFRHPPLPVCYKCHSFRYEWHKVSGKGVIYSYTIVHHPTHPALKERVPYNIVVVELPDADNVFMTGNLIDCPNDDINIGIPVEVVWEDKAEDVSLAQWKRSIINLQR